MTTVEPPLSPPPPPVGAHPGQYSPPPPTPLMTVRKDKPTILAAEIAGVLLAGLAFNFALRTGVNTLVATMGILIVGALLLATNRVQQRGAKLVVAGAMALAPWLVIRSSIGLTAVTLLSIGALLALATGLSKTGAFQGLTVLGMVGHLVAQSLEWVYGLAMVRRLVGGRGTNTQWSAWFRGIAFAIPIVGIFALLLASADDVFASVLSVDGLPTVFGHVALSAFIAMLLLGFVSRAAHETESFSRGPGRGLTSLEVKVVLGAVAALFASFVATQIAVSVGGVDHVLETAGLTQAEHARRGFFQLLWVAAITLAMLGTIRAIRSLDAVPAETDDVDAEDASAAADDAKPVAVGRDRFVPLALVILTLTLIITGISIQRLLYYVGSFGLTPLRFWSLAGACWIGVLIIGYAVAIARTENDVEGKAPSPFPAFLVASAAVLVFGLNVVNPDSFVTNYNLTTLPADSVDTVALGRLSADNIGAIEANLDRLDTEDQQELINTVCFRFNAGEPRNYGVLAWNLADVAEDRFVEANCVLTRSQD